MASCDYHYTVFFELAEEGGFVVTCPALPGLDGLPLPPDVSRLRSSLHRETVTVAVEGV